jgi:hypothetical protein
MSACVITAEIFDAFLKCESKAYFSNLPRGTRVTGVTIQW